MIAKKFKNFTQFEFTWKWDGTPHTFPAGMEIFLEDYKADHFAKHLVDVEMNRLGLLTNNMKRREELIALCFPTDEAITPVEAFHRNEEAKIEPKEKEVEFADLEKPEESIEEEKVELPKRGRPKKYE